MKKSLLMLTAAFLLVGLAGCDNTSTPVGSDSTGGGSESAAPATGGLADVDFSSVTADLGEKEYIAALYVADSVADFPEYVSVYATGAWGEGLNAEGVWDGTWPTTTVAALTALEGNSRVLYTKVTWDAEAYKGTQPEQYQVTLGYNANSGLAAGSQGVNWTYKSDECATYAGLEAPSWTIHDKVIWLTTNVAEGASGIHTFSTVPPKPVQLTNYHIVYGFPADLPTYAKAVMVGTFAAANWAYDDSLVMSKVETPDSTWPEAKVYYEANVGTVIATAALSFKIVLLHKDATELSWTYQMTPGDDNQSHTPLAIDGSDNAHVFHSVLTLDPNVVMPTDPSLLCNVEMRWVNTTDGGTVPEGREPYLNGSWNWNAEWDTRKMTWDETNGWWDYTLSIPPATYEFGLIYDSSWTGKIVFYDETKTGDDHSTNATFTITGASIVTLTAPYSMLGNGSEENRYGGLTVTVTPANS